MGLPGNVSKSPEDEIVVGLDDCQGVADIVALLVKVQG